MIQYTLTNEDVEKIERFIAIKNRGMYADGRELTDVYNRVLHKNVNQTSCGSCLRQRITELEGALMHFKEKQALIAKENNAVTEPSKEDAIKERMAKVRAAKKNKKEE